MTTWRTSAVAEPGAPSGEVTIAGRAFTLGTVYARWPHVDGRWRRRLLSCTVDSLLPGGRVTVAMELSSKQRVMTGEDWVAWAGEPVGGGGR
jgi:hypothetical protein